jgi:hypothetical protein
VTRKLSIGANISDYWAAAVEGKEGAFQLSRADHDLLAGPLDQPPRKPVVPPGSPQFTPSDDNGPGSTLGVLRGLFKPGGEAAKAAAAGNATPVPATPVPLATPVPPAAPPQ